MNHRHRFEIDENQEKVRIDSFLAEKIADLSRSYLRKGIEAGWVKANGNAIKPNYKLKARDVITVDVPPTQEHIIAPEDLPLNILYEDEDIIVIDKARGVVVYPAPGNYSGTMVNALLHYTKELSKRNGESRPGIIHRLDKDTSGVIIVAKNDVAHKNISDQLKNRRVKKIYWALVWGRVEDHKATINAPIGRHPSKRKEMTVTGKNSKEAITHFKVLEKFSDFTLLEVALETGRTHQIRVHMKFIRHPIVGDRVYSNKKSPFPISGQALHAYKLGFHHPRSGEYVEFTAPLPRDITSILEKLRQREV